MNRSLKAALIVIGLLVVLALSHQFTGSSLEDLTANRPASAAQAQKKPAEPEKPAEPVLLPDPVGPPDAPVKVEVFITSNNKCDTSTLEGMKQLAGQFDNHVRIEFKDLLDPKTKQKAQDAKLGCETGLMINGRTKFIIPERGIKGVIRLDGPVGVKNYNLEDVKAVVEYLLKEKGKK